MTSKRALLFICIVLAAGLLGAWLHQITRQTESRAPTHGASVEIGSEEYVAAAQVACLNQSEEALRNVNMAITHLLYSNTPDYSGALNIYLKHYGEEADRVLSESILTSLFSLGNTDFALWIIHRQGDNLYWVHDTAVRYARNLDPILLVQSISAALKEGRCQDTIEAALEFLVTESIHLPTNELKTLAHVAENADSDLRTSQHVVTLMARQSLTDAVNHLAILEESTNAILRAAATRMRLLLANRTAGLLIEFAPDSDDDAQRLQWCDIVVELQDVPIMTLYRVQECLRSGAGGEEVVARIVRAGKVVAITLKYAGEQKPLVGRFVGK